MTGDSGTGPTTGRCGGRGGTSPFPAKGQRTGEANARTSTRGRWGCDFHTWIGRGGGGGVLSTVRSSLGGSGEGRLRVEAIPAKEGSGLDRISSGG
jgi:hypothetical protein